MRFLRGVCGAIAIAAAASSLAAEPLPPPPTPAQARNLDALVSSAQVRKALDAVKADEARTLAEQKELVVIAAPPFKEEARAREFLKRISAIGFPDATIDKEGNVIAVRRGNGRGPKLIVSAHLDTVFPPETKIEIREEGGRIFAPGIGDDARGLVELLSVARALDASGIKTVGDIYFVGTVGEEGLGDLRGARALMKDHPDADGFISIDGSYPDRIVSVAVASHRYRVTFTGPGGHSFGAFGRPSAIHAMGRAIERISDIKPPAQPKTTFTVGTVTGGISVNAIAAEASMEVDIRSVGTAPLFFVDSQIKNAIRLGVAAENDRWESSAISFEIKSVGNRPGGMTLPDSPMIQAVALAIRAVGMQPRVGEPASTDANIAIGMGIPAVTIGRGGKTENQHSVKESFDPKDAYLGVQKNLLAVLALVGVEGVSEPLLPVRAKK